MRYGNVPGIDKPISRLVQGINPARRQGPEPGFALLDAVWEQGYTTFDTGRVYGDADRFLGDWLRERGVRDRAVILGKGAHHNQERRRVTPEDIRQDLDASLKELQTDHIDLYVLHRDDPGVPVGPLVEALNGHLRAGKIRAFGGSNWTHERIAEANAYAREHDLVPFAVSSPNFSLAEQVQEPWAGCVSISGPQGEAARAYYQQTRMPLFTWSSLAGGFFSGRLRRDNTGEFTTGPDKLAVTSYAYDQNFRRLDRVEELAKEKNASVPQIALAYVLSQPLNVFALVGCRSGDEFRANVEALDITLTPQELAYLDLRADSPR
jgi:aryl-alcohol dehydrogenase-like predicted oxidoreductase